MLNGDLVPHSICMELGEHFKLPWQKVYVSYTIKEKQLYWNGSRTKFSLYLGRVCFQTFYFIHTFCECKHIWIHQILLMWVHTRFNNSVLRATHTKFTWGTAQPFGISSRVSEIVSEQVGWWVMGGLGGWLCVRERETKVRLWLSEWVSNWE